MLQPMRILKHSEKRFKNIKARLSHVIVLDDLSCLLSRMVSSSEPEKTILLRKPNNKIVVNIGPVPTTIQKLQILLDTEAGWNNPQENRLTIFPKRKVMHVSEKIKIYDANDKPLHIICSDNLYVHVDRMTELVTFPVFEQLAVPVKLGCDFADHYIAVIYLKTRFVRVVDAYWVTIDGHHSKQQSAKFTNLEIVCLSKRKGHPSPQYPVSVTRLYSSV